MLVLDKVRKTFGSKNVLNDISMHVFAGERAALVGPNGAGKSTLFSIITDQISVDKGDCKIRKGIRTGHLRQQFTQEDKNTELLAYTKKSIARLDEISDEIHACENELSLPGADKEALLKRLGNLQTEFEHLGGYKMENLAETALCGLGFSTADFTRKLSEFSGGWQMRAELARVLIAIPDLLLLDEPSNYLDVPAIEWLQDYLDRTFDGTLLLVSHDRFLLNRLSNVTFELFQGRVTRYAGSYDYYVKERAERNRHLMASHRNQEAKKEKLESFINRFKAKATKASQAQSRMKELEKMEEIEAPVQEISGAAIKLKQPPRCSHQVAELEGIGKTYDGEKYIFKNVDFSVINGDKLGIVGTNGMGKSTLMRVISGAIPHETGKLRIGANVVMGYHSQDYTETMNPDFTVFEMVKSAGVDAKEADIRSMLGGFGFRGDDIEKKVGVLSGGEKVRLSLARMLVNPPNLLLLDEPTTHLDIQSREALQEALSKFEGTIILVSHDIEFLRNVATNILEISPKGVEKFFGDYAYYRAKINERLKSEMTGETASAAKPKPVETSASVVVDRKEQKRIEAERRKILGKKKAPLEKKINEAEEQMMLLEEEKEELIASFLEDLNGEQIRIAQERLGQVEVELSAAEEAWEENSEALEELKAEYGA